MKFFPKICFFLIFASCNFSDGVTKSNYSYKFHIDKEGESPKVGDLVIFKEKVFLNSKEVFSTEDFGQKEIILPKEENLIRPLPPNYEILFQMSPGDSVSVTQKLKDLDHLPKGYDADDVMTYYIKLIEIQPQEKRKPSKKKDRTKDNYPYEIINQTHNILAQPGDFVRFREELYANDSLFFFREKSILERLPPRSKIPTPPPGNYEALLLSGIGDSIHLSQLMENATDLPHFLSKKDTINYRIQVLDILTPGEYEIFKIKKAAQAKATKEEVKARRKEVIKSTQDNIEKFKDGKLEDDLIYTPSGLKYLIHEKGKGKFPFPTQEVEVQYAGFLMNGTLFDDSFKEGEPFRFPLAMDRVIKGWDEGIAKLPVGSKATLFIPYRIAYGRSGRPPKIPRRSDLVFYLEVVDAE